MNTGEIEPLMPEESRSAALINLATELQVKARALATRLPSHVADSIGDLVRNMNCYYSNLIEGHDTHPLDIERALLDDFAKDTTKRELQLEAKAHIEVQQMIDADDVLFETSEDYIRWIHRAFCERLPEDLLWSKNSNTGDKEGVIPGEFRKKLVEVGQHIPPDDKKIVMFLKRFHEVYDPDQLNKLQNIVAVAASHHRLLWIHPFLDGNGRVARLFSHAYLRFIDVGSPLWSISRGLARHVREYRARLMEADQPRRGDLDGRGNLTAKGLEDFCEFFIKTCIDQIEFMESLIKPDELLRRIERYIKEEQERGHLPKGSFSLLREAFFIGSIERGKASIITGYKERQARTILNRLVEARLLVSETPKGSVRLNFPANVVGYWFPQLYPFE